MVPLHDIDVQALEDMRHRLTLCFAQRFPERTCERADIEAMVAATLGSESWDHTVDMLKKEKHQPSAKESDSDSASEKTVIVENRPSIPPFEVTKIPGYAWLKTLSELFKAKTKDRMFCIQDRSLPLETVFNHEGLLSLFVEPMIEVDQLLESNQRMLSYVCHPHCLLNVGPVVYVERIPRFLNHEALVNEVLKTLPKPNDQGMTSLDALYDRWYDHTQKSGLEFLDFPTN